MNKNLTELQSRNDSLWLDAICDKQYYEGKDNAHITINRMLSKYSTPERLRAELLKEQRASEAHRDTDRDVGYEGEAWAYYDGEVAGYREMINELDEVYRDKD